MNILVGDIGGTKSLLALASWDGKRWRLRNEQRFENAHWPGLKEVSCAYLERTDIQLGELTGVCFGVAGPVHQEADRQFASLTNLPWTLDNRLLASELEVPVAKLINDFEALGFGVGQLEEDDLIALYSFPAQEDGPKLVFGAGTGLGLCQLVGESDGRRHLLPSEIGHTDFAAANIEQLELQRYYLQQQSRVSRENLLSGGGLARIFHFLSSKTAPSPDLVHALNITEDKAAEIARFAIEEEEPVAKQALELFADIYGSQAGDMALAYRPTGGLYLGGGIAPKILVKPEYKAIFLNAYANKAPMTELVEKTPLYIIANPYAPLLGCAYAIHTQHIRQ